MKSFLYHLIRKILTQKSRNQLKGLILRIKMKLGFFYKVRYGTFNTREISNEIKSKIGGDFDILMVHCSMNDLVPMYSQSANDLLNELVSICRPDKTLVMPAFIFGGTDQDVIKYYKTKKTFNAQKDPSQMGILSFLFGRLSNVQRSLHPVISVYALGPLAKELVEKHHLCDTNCGENTPFGIMAQRKTIILGIGTYYFRCLSQVHAAEDIMGDKFPIKIKKKKIPVMIIDNNNQIQYELSVSTDQIPRRIEILNQLLSEGDLNEWEFHGVPLFHTTAKSVTDTLIAAAKEGVTIYTE